MTLVTVIYCRHRRHR